MERSTPRRIAWSRLLLLCVAAAATAGVLQARAQPDSKGFISVDCGLLGKTGYTDDKTKLSFAPDDGFTDAGTSHSISAEYIKPLLAKRYHKLRSFPHGVRNCYTLRLLVSGLKYLLRATFKYGNYDGLNKPPKFDLHIGVNYWTTVNMTGNDDAEIMEAIVVVPGDSVQVCLMNTGSGTPFISGLDLRPLKNSLYPQVNETQGLVLVNRLNFGPTDPFAIIRYPDDPHDRVWFPWVDATTWSEISTTRRVLNVDNDLFEAPSAVMQTAIIPRNTSMNIEFSWDSEPKPNDPSPGYFTIMHFTEVQLLPSNAVRQIYININGILWVKKSGYTPDFLFTNALYNANAYHGFAQYNVSINATANSTLPPTINAIEVFSVISTTNVATDSQDVSAITAIKEKYQVKDWMGDPCVPKTLTWDRLTCSYAISSPARITGLNLSSSGLTGQISSSFANLKAVQYLDLSNNNLSGLIPDNLSQLSSLNILDLTGNQLNGSIPSGLLKRIQEGSLNLRYANNTNLCTDGNLCQPAKTKSKLAIYIVVPVVLIMVIVLVGVLLFCLLRRHGKGSTKGLVKPKGSYGQSSSLRLENRQFTYEELEMITNSFQRVLGRGGFGYVYHGFLEDGTQVAVKLRSESSNQGDKQFLAEAQILTRIHHKNLVSLIGYCKDGEHMALIYEYMSEGTLQDKVTGKNNNGRSLTWRLRLRIALESAQGLEYLHKGCNPHIIHMDVKPANILLNSRLEAKIADFGLSKAFNADSVTHVSTTTLAGTYGYVDPEYLATSQPTTKSDVYSFGVVLLEIITGKPAIFPDPEPTAIIQWARQRLARGNIESVVDARMHGDHDVNSVWKAADIALKCTEQGPAQRPTMTDVVAQLHECIELEATRCDDGETNGGFYTCSETNHNLIYNIYSTDNPIGVNQNRSAIEMEHNCGRVPTMITGPAAR